MGPLLLYGYIGISLFFCEVSLWGAVLLTPIYVFAFLYVTQPEPNVILVYGKTLTEAQVDAIAEHLEEELDREVLIYEVHK